MGPKRAAKKAGSAGPSKKAKLEIKHSDIPESRWEFEGDKRTWTQYSSAVNSLLCDAFENDKKQLDFDLDNGCKMSVNFEKMTQKNKKTGWERPVRLAVKDVPDGLYYVWSWEDEKGNFNPYGAKATFDLETTFRNEEESCHLEACHRSYTVDMMQMEQKNTATNVIRKVSREESKAIKADPEAATPVASNTPDVSVKATKSSAGKSRGKIKAEPEDDDTNDAAKSGRSKAKSGPKERPAVKKFVMSGKAPVDPECTTMVNKAHVFYEGKDVYDCMLNQTSVANNNNKYFLIQLLEENDKKSYYTWFRWGRVGYGGQNNLIPCGPNLEQAKKLFMKKFTEKTKNDWASRQHFVKVAGKYDLLQMDYSSKIDSMHTLRQLTTESESYLVRYLCDEKLQIRGPGFFRTTEEIEVGNEYEVQWGRLHESDMAVVLACGNTKEMRALMRTQNSKTPVPNKPDSTGKSAAKPQETDEVDAPAKEKKKENVPDSKLDKKLQSLVELICDVKSMEDAVVEMQYDARKAPLGKLTSDQVKAGYTALKNIENCIEKKDFGGALTRACDEFYTRIPHDFGMRPPAKITTKQEIKKKIELLEALGDIQIALKMLKEGDTSENPVDRHYHAMKCELDPIDQSSDEFKMLGTYLQNTHASTHNQYKMKLLEVYKVDKDGESKHFNDCGNRQLLWHGSRLTNWMGILSQGLRIAPPEAPVTGYMFGKGVYFADMSSKSANYCFATRKKNTGLLLLCDVALGKTNDLLAADYRADKLPAGKQSVKGAGKIAPDPAHTTKTPDGAMVPWGKPKDTGTNNPKGYTLNYNEFIVYDTRQIQMKYLLKVNFNFK